MAVTINGRQLGVARNGVFSSVNTDPIPGGRLWPEAALTWNAMVDAYVADGGSVARAMPAGPRSSARTLEAQREFYAHQPPPAAVPGTSNHGWGIAVDAGFREFVAWLHRNAHRFGWSHDEGARVGEWWHWRYVGASAATLRALRRELDKWRDYTASERRWIREYDRLVKDGRDLARRRVLRRVMEAQRKRLWRVAQPLTRGGDGRGWDAANRRARYESLLARSK